MPQSTSRTLSVFPLLLLLAACGPAPHDIVILHGRVMNPETGLDAPLNVGIDDGRIAAITEEDLRTQLYPRKWFEKWGTHAGPMTSDGGSG